MHNQRNKSLAIDTKAARKTSKRGSKKIAVPRVFETKMQRSLRTKGSAEVCDLQAESYSMKPKPRIINGHVSRVMQHSSQQ